MSQGPEVIKADPVLRRRALIGFATLIIVSLAAAAYFRVYGTPMERYMQYVAALDRTAAVTSLTKAGSLLVATMFVLVSSIAAGMFWFGSRMWKAQQWPLPTARLIADSPVARGRDVRILGGFLMTSGTALAISGVYVCFRLLGMFDIV